MSAYRPARSAPTSDRCFLHQPGSFFIKKDASSAEIDARFNEIDGCMHLFRAGVHENHWSFSEKDRRSDEKDWRSGEKESRSDEKERRSDEKDWRSGKKDSRSDEIARDQGKIVARMPRPCGGVSEILCARHIMTPRSMYAEQNEEVHRRGRYAADDSQGAA